MLHRAPATRRRSFGFTVAMTLALAPTPLTANDSVGHLAAGGLVFGRTDAIEMRTEDLHISTSEVRVRYTFHNRTDQDVTTIVAFPLPDAQAPSEENNVVVPAPDDPANFMGFQTKVDGKVVDMEVEQKAIAIGIDRTSALGRLALPVSPLAPGLSERLATLPETTLDLLRTQGIVDFEILDAGTGLKRHVRPLWSVRTIYYWTQIFPAGRDLIVEHRYKPSVGGSAQTSVGAPYASKEQTKEYDDRYCMTDGFVAAARALQKQAQSNSSTILTEQRLEYVLTTGANWAGAIRQFRLTVDKGAPENLVSFCMDGVRKLSPTEFAVEKSDFYPTRNLEILILRPIRTQ